MANIKDGSLLVLENAGTKYRYSGANLRADVNEWITAAGGGGGGTGVDDLQAVCLRGANYNGTMTVDNLNVDININTPAIYGIQMNADNLGVNEDISCTNLGVVSNLSANEGRFASLLSGPFDTRINGDGGLQSVVVYNTNPGGKEMMCNGSGFIGTKPTFRRSAATNITPVDTSNFVTVLKAVSLNRADLSIDNETRSEIGLFVEDLQTTTASSMLTHYDGDSVEFSSTNYEHFLFGVCKQQQELIENLTTRIEQLEADHASAMNNMGDTDGSSTY